MPSSHPPPGGRPTGRTQRAVGGADDRLSWRVWLRMRLAAASPRALALNIALAMVLVFVVIAAILLVATPDVPDEVGRTATVGRGAVTASVTGNGNSVSSLFTPVSFAESGTLTSIDVKPGDAVESGAVLAAIDPAGADADLRTAQAALDGAQAAYRQAAAGPSDVQKQQDQLAVDRARQAVTDAEAAVRNAEDQLGLHQTSTKTAIENAKEKLDNDTVLQNSAVENAEDALAACRDGDSGSTSQDDSGSSATPSKVPAAYVRPASMAAECTAQEQALTLAEQTRESVLDTDRQAVTTAEQSRDQTLLEDNFAIEKARQSVTTAQGQVRSAELTAKANLTPRTPDEIAEARSNVDAAQVEVDNAERAMDQTVLKAPQAGVVLEVNGHVGEPTGASNGSSSGGSGSGSSSGGSSADSGDSSESGSSEAFMTIANLSQMAVTANIAESDAARIQLGQRAQVTFPATGATVGGSVTQITPQSTEENNVVFFPVTVSLDSAPPETGAGATASLSISAGSKDNVLMVPSAAVTTVGRTHTVTVRRDGVDTPTPVQVGLVGDTTTEITGGLDEGDVVVLPSPAAATGNGGLPPRGGGR